MIILKIIKNTFKGLVLNDFVPLNSLALKFVAAFVLFVYAFSFICLKL